MRKAVKIFSDVIFVAGIIIAGSFSVAHFTGRQPFKLYVVSSGSMEPSIKTGSVIAVVPKAVYQVGDIISFKTSDNSKSTTTHRIVGIGGGFFKVAGDANDDPDPNLVPNSAVVGSVRLSVPYVGYLSGFAKTPKGFILLVIIPATIIIYEELKGLGVEIKKLLQKFHPKTDDSTLRKLNPAIIILPVFFAVLVTLSISLSFFIDKETSASNVFSRGISVPTSTPSPPPTPTPTPL